MNMVVIDVQCRRCGATEMHPDGDKLLIRALKVEIDGIWYSQCLVCAGHYNADLELQDEAHFDPTEGWFKS